MKKQLIIAAIIFAFFTQACKSPVTYHAYFDKQNTTEVVLTKGNFKVLGHFTGTAKVKKTTNFSKAEGLLSKARKDMIENAEKAGYELKGSRTFINTSIDYIETDSSIKAIISADLIEFK